MGAAGGKGFLAVGAQPMAIYSIRTLAKLSDLLSIVLVVVGDQQTRAAEIVADSGPWPVPVHLARGGAERQDSVAAGLALVESGADLVVVHDAARPFVPLRCFQACIDTAARSGAAIVAVPAHDTIKVVGTGMEIVQTLDRRGIWLAQTPQVFRADLLRRAYAQARAEGYTATDDATLVERLGAAVHVVPGESANRKITTPDDLEWAESYLHGQRGVD